MQAGIDPLGFLKDQKLAHSLPLLSAYATMYDANGAVDSRLQVGGEGLGWVSFKAGGGGAAYEGWMRALKGWVRLAWR